MSLNPTLVRANEARALCEDWVEALLAGALPSLRAVRRER